MGKYVRLKSAFIKCLLWMRMFETPELLALADTEAEFNFIPFHDDSLFQIILLQGKKKENQQKKTHTNQQVNNYTNTKKSFIRSLVFFNCYNFETILDLWVPVSDKEKNPKLSLIIYIYT